MDVSIRELHLKIGKSEKALKMALKALKSTENGTESTEIGTEMALKIQKFALRVPSNGGSPPFRTFPAKLTADEWIFSAQARRKRAIFSLSGS